VSFHMNHPWRYGISVFIFKTVTALYHFLTLVMPIAQKASLPA
jgi:hypothetical protein